MRPPGSMSVEPLRPEDHILGPDSAPLTVVGYCDFECPYCSQAWVRLKALREHCAEQVRFVFRHFPLTDKHPLAQQAGEASEAAARQGQFWLMHDVLFEHQDDLNAENLHQYAEMVRLDVPQFKQELHGRLHASRVLYEVKSGRRSGVSGTPTFFVNNARLEDEERLEDLIGRAA